MDKKTKNILPFKSSDSSFFPQQLQETNIYFISGLGADERAFQRIRLPAGYQVHHLPWLPVKGDEDIGAYARRLAASIDPSRPFVLAGLSFGGIVAMEICKFLKPEKLILFSTVKCRRELPALYRRAGQMQLYRFVPDKLIQLSLPFLSWFFGPLDEDARKLIDSFREKSDPIFLRWALKQISCWQNDEIFTPNLHIQGGKDRTFPVSLLKADYLIESGGHLCVFTNAAEVNRILEKELSVRDPA